MADVGEAQVAEQLKEKMRDALERVCAIMDEAVSHGMQFNYQIAPEVPFNKHGVQNLRVLKVY